MKGGYEQVALEKALGMLVLNSISFGWALSVAVKCAPVAASVMLLCIFSSLSLWAAGTKEQMVHVSAMVISDFLPPIQQEMRLRGDTAAEIDSFSKIFIDKNEQIKESSSKCAYHLVHASIATAVVAIAIVTACSFCM